MDEAPNADAEVLLDSLLALVGDRSGVETFARYLWQAKQVARRWLTCLSEQGPTFVVCEHVDDAVLVHRDALVFQQYKTRDKGSWSGKNMCASGLDASVRSYALAREAELADVSRFELWLQGPPSPDAATAAFIRSPMDADAAVRSRLIDLGNSHDVLKAAAGSWLEDFLGRLSIRAYQPNHLDTDARALLEIGNLWDSCTSAELRAIYKSLLDKVTEAQGGQGDLTDLGGRVAAAWAARGMRAASAATGSTGLAPLESQVLTLGMLEELTPPVPGTPREKLLEQIAAGRYASMLELKMRMAGADTATIEDTKAMRAETDIERQQLLASRTDAATQLDALAERLLRFANATARSVALVGAANPGVAHRPGQAIVAELMRAPVELAALDREALFGDGQLLYGLIAHLSDECRYWWGYQ